MTAYEQLSSQMREPRGLREEDTPLPPELELQALWFAGAFGREFETSDGRTVTIRQFGEWNRSAGPDFLHAAILIINIPSKNISGFRRLVDEIEASEIDNVLFVSSTSVYKNVAKTITESDTDSFSHSPLLEIEGLLRGCSSIARP